MNRLIGVFLLSCAVGLAACGPSAPSAQQSGSPPTQIATNPTQSSDQSARVDLSGVKSFLLDRTAALTDATKALKVSAEQYYALAKDADFDYATLWSHHRQKAAQILLSAKHQWQRANPAYEQMEGLVAGVPSLAQYDVILDAGARGSDDPQHAVPFDLTLPDGRVLKQPGNFFYLTETALWGTEPDFVIQDVQADLDGNGKVDFGEALPDANFLVAAVTEFDRYAGELALAAQSWHPTESDVFTALVVMTPTMSEYFESWKNSRYVAGEEATETGFVGASRLSDIIDILKGLNVTYTGVRSLVASVDTAQSEQIGQGLADLQSFVANIYTQEQQGKRFAPEEAELLGAEAQNQATAITGQITQAAAKLKITLAE